MHEPVHNCMLRQGYQMVSLPLLLAVVMLAGGCAGGPPMPARDTAVLAESVSMEAAHIDAPGYRVNSRHSEIRLLVYRDGPLARFGHNHVITGPVNGELQAGTSTAGSGFRLEIPVVEMQVDITEARAEEGSAFTGEVSEQARIGTRENLLGPQLLNADAHPLIVIESLTMTGPRWNPEVTARVTLRGETRDLRFPAAVSEHDDVITVIASFRIRQSNFGIEPFNILGGGLRVADEIDVRVRVVARQDQ